MKAKDGNTSFVKSEICIRMKQNLAFHKKGFTAFAFTGQNGEQVVLTLTIIFCFPFPLKSCFPPRKNKKIKMKLLTFAKLEFTASHDSKTS